MIVSTAALRSRRWANLIEISNEDILSPISQSRYFFNFAFTTTVWNKIIYTLISIQPPIHVGSLYVILLITSRNRSLLVCLVMIFDSLFDSNTSCSKPFSIVSRVQFTLQTMQPGTVFQTRLHNSDDFLYNGFIQFLSTYESLLCDFELYAHDVNTG